MQQGKQIGAWIDGEFYRRIEVYVREDQTSFSAFTKTALINEVMRRDAQHGKPLGSAQAAPVVAKPGTGSFGLSVRIPHSSLRKIESQAEKRSIPAHILASRLLDTIAKHDLFLAVLDDADPGVMIGRPA